MQKRIYQQSKEEAADGKSQPPEGYGTLHSQNDGASDHPILPKQKSVIDKVRAQPLPSQWRNEDVLRRHERVWLWGEPNRSRRTATKLKSKKKNSHARAQPERRCKHKRGPRHIR